MVEKVNKPESKPLESFLKDIYSKKVNDLLNQDLGEIEEQMHDIFDSEDGDQSESSEEK